MTMDKTVKTRTPIIQLNSPGQINNLQQKNNLQQSPAESLITGMKESDMAFMVSTMSLDQDFVNILDNNDSEEVTNRGTIELKEYLVAKQNLEYLKSMADEQEQNADIYPNLLESDDS